MSADLVEGRLLGRPNRFRLRVALRSRTVDAFLPNPGRLTELLSPGSRLRLVPAGGADRRTHFDVLAAFRGGEWVCLDTRLANVAVQSALEQRALNGLPRYRVVRPEAPWGDSRFDFLLREPSRCWLEVKSCSLVLHGRALFPDAPTTRGTKHLRELARLARSGTDAAVLFVVVRRAARFSPNEETDPVFAAALRDAETARVRLMARRASLRGPRLVLGRRIPIDL